MGNLILFVLGILSINFLKERIDDFIRIQELEAKIDATIRMDWSNGIPLDRINEAHQICLKDSSLIGCDTVDVQIRDITISLHSCLADERSQLCKSVVDVVGKHPIASILPKGHALQLPDSPFYWDMPTSALDALAGNFGYRNEASMWWWDRWCIPIISWVGLMSIVSITLFLFFRHKKSSEQHRMLEIARQRARDGDEERLRQRNEEDARIQAVHRAKVAHDANMLRTKQLAEKELSEQNAIRAAAKFAAEQAERAEAAALLSAAFKTISKSKRR